MLPYLIELRWVERHDLKLFSLDIWDRIIFSVASTSVFFDFYFYFYFIFFFFFGFLIRKTCP